MQGSSIAIIKDVAAINCQAPFQVGVQAPKPPKKEKKSNSFYYDQIGNYLYLNQIHCYRFMAFLAPTEAQGVKMCVSLSVCLSRGL